jgi:hypothetical protein
MPTNGLSMSTIRRDDALDISVSHGEIATLLGYGRAGIPDRVHTMIAEIEKLAPALLSPACAYRLLTNKELSHSRFLHHIDRVAVCLVTIGGALEKQVKQHKERGELGRALVLDAYGSAAAEATAEAAESIIAKTVDDMGLRSSKRFSPGYAGWDVDEQKWVLPVLEGETLGVTLTEGCMMSPRKSITFAVTVGENPIEVRTDDICDACHAVNCPWKDTPEKCYGRVAE